MRISKLESFVAVARYKSFTKASQVRYLVQSTVSHQIKTLEDELGFLLFERDSHTVTLTPAGEQFYHDIEKPLEMLRQAARRAKAVAEGDTGSLIVGVSGINQTDRLNGIRYFQDDNPGISVAYRRVRNSNVFQDLDEGVFDIALIRLGEGIGAEYSTADVRMERIYLVASHKHPVAAYSKIAFKDTLHYSQLFARDIRLTEEENRQSFLKDFGVQGDMDLNNIILTEDMDIQQLMLEANEGIALVPESIIDFEQNRLAVIELVDPPPSIRVGWVFRKDNPNPVVHQLSIYLSNYHSR